MKELDADVIIEAVAELAQEANFYLGRDVIDRIKEMKEKEESPVAMSVIEIMLNNYREAMRNQVPICQDTGTSVIFLELGQDLHVVGGGLNDAVNEGIRIGYEAGYLRKSMVQDPVFNRKNTGDNTPAIIHTEVVPGDTLKITFAPKGGGAENMSRLKMITPSAGLQGIEDFVLETVKLAGGKACPPLVVGIGVGGNFESCAMLAKKALMRDLKTPNPDEKLNEFEEDLLEKINKTGIGPQGFGGRTTALSVNIRTAPCHITGLPTAVNLQCHASRHKSIILEGK
jgi:fumarate hydratase subunit alpha